MAQKNLDKMSLKELQALKSDVDKAIANYEKRKRQEALAELEAVAKKHGYSVSDIVGGPQKRSAKAKRPAKYRNPDDGTQSWSGRGRQPAWFKAALADGKSPEDLAI